MFPAVSRHTAPSVPPHTEAPPRPERVVLINDVSVIRGGATNLAVLSSRLLAERGVPVTLLTGDAGEGAHDLPAAVSIVVAGSAHILQGGRIAAGVRGLYNVQVEGFVRRWIAANDTPHTVYHLHGWSKILSPSIFRALQPVAGRWTVSAHDFFLACPNGGYSDFKHQRPCYLRPMSSACLLRNCDRRHYGHKVWRVVRHTMRRSLCGFDREGGRVLAVHDGMIPLLERGGIARDRLRVLRNPVVPWCRDRVAAERNRRFFFVGRLEEDKGVLLLASAARRAGVPLAVIGAGPLAGQLAAEFPEVEQLGWRSHEQIGELAVGARAFVMPTRVRDTSGLAVLEALTSGIPVVLPEYIMLAREVVENGFGLACDPHDTEAFARTLSLLAHDDAAVAAMSRRAYEHALELSMTPDAWADALLALYGEMLAENQSSRMSGGAQAR